jgi:hypothetical protein
VAALNPKLFNSQRLEQQQNILKEFKQEVEMCADAKLFTEKRLDSKPIVLLPKNLRVFCKEIGQAPKSRPKTSLRPVSITSSESKIDVLLRD